MTVLEYFNSIHDEVTAWRRSLHAMPELLYDLPKTSRFVAEKLREFGVDEITENIAQSGIVAVIKGAREGSRRVGLRADMDALPIPEQTNLAYASKHEGLMHACGHDGHTAMLLGAARYLCENRDFAGSVVLIFQPAEETGAGGKAMIDEGLFKKWPVDAVYGLHNQPGIEIGHFICRKGPMLASSDEFDITIHGKGGHAAAPQTAIDPLMVASSILSAAQAIVARNLSPFDSAALSVTRLEAGDSYNTIPPVATMSGTIRTLNEKARAMMKERLRQVVEHSAALHGATAELNIKTGYPVLDNTPANAAYIADVARSIVPESQVNGDCTPILASEDFAFMLQEVPGAYMLMGNGSTASLHNAAYDFNDAAIPYGSSFLVTAALNTLNEA